jgi:hypothetical protein
MIDLGIPSQYGCAIDYMQRGRWELWGIVFTHFHRDHTGEARSFLSRIGLLSSISGKIVLPPTTKMPHIGHRIIQSKRSAIQVIRPINGDIIFEDIEIIDGHEMYVKIQAIVPSINQDQWATLTENDCSMGCLITVAYGAKVWRMLTLGDMVADTAERSIQDVLTDNNGGFLPVNVIKVPHHFSANNHMDIISRLYAQGYQTRNGLRLHPTIVSSGYTGADFNPRVVNYLLQSIDKYPPITLPGDLCILFNRDEILREADIQALVGPSLPPSEPIFCRAKRELQQYFDIVALDYFTWRFNPSSYLVMDEEPGNNVFNCKRGRPSSPEVSTGEGYPNTRAKKRAMARRGSPPFA